MYINYVIISTASILIGFLIGTFLKKSEQTTKEINGISPLTKKSGEQLTYDILRNLTTVCDSYSDLLSVITRLRFISVKDAQEFERVILEIELDDKPGAKGELILIQEYIKLLKEEIKDEE